MPRVPYKPADTAEPPALVEAIRRRRGGRLLHLDRMLLHSPPYARGWNALLGAVRGELGLPARLRELAICAVAALTGAEYEFHHHAPLFLEAGGTPAQLDALRAFTGGGATAPFDDTERAVLRYAHEMTRDVAVRDATFADAARAVGGAQAMVELTAVIATYNMVARFLVALEILPEDTDGD
jgi:alkylhydroperoxidase family enzyme